MPAQSVDLFHTQYTTEFWRAHALSQSHGQIVAKRRTLQRRQSGTGYLVTREDQLETHAALHYVLSNSRPSAAPDGLVIASGNVQAFNGLFADLPTLAHPAALVKGPVPLTLRQLNYEYTELEMGNTGDAGEIHNTHASLPAVPAPKRYSDLDGYDRQARAHLRSDKARLCFKYDYLKHLGTAAFHHIDQPREVAERFDIRVLRPPQKQALKELHKSIKRSLHAAKEDLLILENFYNRAASGWVQLERATFDNIRPSLDHAPAPELSMTQFASDSSAPSTPRGQAIDYEIAPMLLPNLFGPGELRINTAYTAMRMRKLWQKTFETIDMLRLDVLRPRTSELAVLDKSYTRLLVLSMSKPLVLGPLQHGRLFDRDAQHPVQD